MDSSLSNFDLNRLTDSDKQELQQVLQSEAQKTQIQQTVHELSQMCFKKCITSITSGGQLDGKEETCQQNCVNRFIDSQLTILNQVQQMRGN